MDCAASWEVLNAEEIKDMLLNAHISEPAFVVQCDTGDWVSGVKPEVLTGMGFKEADIMKMKQALKEQGILNDAMAAYAGMPTDMTGGAAAANAEKQKSADLLFQVALNHERNDNLVEAIKCCKEAAGSGHGGRCAREAHGVEEGGRGGGHSGDGLILSTGELVPKNSVEGAMWVRKAAEGRNLARQQAINALIHRTNIFDARLVINSKVQAKVERASWNVPARV
jgi:hypothetical protein